MEREAGDDPVLVEAKKRFAEAPFAISTLAKLAPFLERSVAKHSKIYDVEHYTANFRLDGADFAMLNFLVEIEESRTEPIPQTTFVNHIANYDQEVEEMEHHVNLVIVNRYSIQQAQEGVASFWRDLKWPQGCSGKDGFGHSMQNRDEVTQILHNSMLKRQDMKLIREARSHTYVFHTGRTSPNRWAEYADVYEGADGQHGITSEIEYEKDVK